MQENNVENLFLKDFILSCYNTLFLNWHFIVISEKKLKDKHKSKRSKGEGNMVSCVPNLLIMLHPEEESFLSLNILDIW